MGLVEVRKVLEAQRRYQTNKELASIALRNFSDLFTGLNREDLARYDASFSDRARRPDVIEQPFFIKPRIPAYIKPPPERK